jgi:hypothetical protein
MNMKKLLIIYLFLLITSSNVHAYSEVTLADFEMVIPCSEQGHIVGFRKKDLMRAKIVPGGTEGSICYPPGRNSKGKRTYSFRVASEGCIWQQIALTIIKTGQMRSRFG